MSFEQATSPRSAIKVTMPDFLTLKNAAQYPCPVLSAGWFHRAIVAPGRLPLFCFLAGMIFGFGFIRLSVRLIRAQVRWWPGNVSSGGVHIHHAVFGVILMLFGGVVSFAIPIDLARWRAAAAAVFGLGAALVLDEFALILHLRDVYWSEQGRTSVDAVFVAVAAAGLLLLGLRPVGVDDLLTANNRGGAVAWLLSIGLTLGALLLAAITLLKGKIWTGLIGLFIPALLLVGAVRLARPHSPWARWRYRQPGPRAARKLTRAARRERRLRRPAIRAKIWIQELIAGRPDQHPRS
jgi:hypothetical protein